MGAKRENMVTLKEIASKCNVSVTTVSNILNGKPKVSEETKQAVLQVVKEMGYQPNYMAQGLRRKKTQTIGIIAEDIAQFTTPKMVESIMAYCEEMGYRTIVQNLRLYGRWQDSWYNQEEEYQYVLELVLQELRSLKVDGIIYLAGHARIIHYFSRKFSMPVVMAYAYTKSPDIPSIVIDDTKSSFELINYLLSLGHKKIGVVAGREDNIHTQKRLLGYQEALYGAGVLFNPEWIRYGNWERESGYQAAGALVEAGATAIFCMADRMAGGVYDYLEEQGLKVGEDISVVGFDDQDIAEFFRPALTTVRLPLSEIGHEAARLLLKKIEETEEETCGDKEVQPEIVEIAIPCTFVERKSVTAIRVK